MPACSPPFWRRPGSPGRATSSTAASDSWSCTSRGGHDASLLLRDLGTVFRGEALSYKPYPCGRPLHAAIDAALAARTALAIAGADDIEAVTIEADPAGHADQFGGSTAKRRPTQVVEAQFAQPFLVATALVHGKVGIAEVDGLGDAAVLALSDRITGVAREGRPRRSLSITVRRTDGRSVTDRGH